MFFDGTVGHLNSTHIYSHTHIHTNTPSECLFAVYVGVMDGSAHTFRCECECVSVCVSMPYCAHKSSHLYGVNCVGFTTGFSLVLDRSIWVAASVCVWMCLCVCAYDRCEISGRRLSDDTIERRQQWICRQMPSTSTYVAVVVGTDVAIVFV